MERTDQELVRIEKANRIREMGMDPFGHRFERTGYALDIKEKYQDISHDEFENRNDIEVVAGRIMFIRKMGKASFFSIKDRTGNIQIYISINDVGEETYNLFKTADLGDIVGVKGRVQSRMIEDEDGNNYKKMEVIAEKITFLSSKKEED